MLRLALHLFYLESGAPGSDQITDGRRVSKKTELVNYQKGYRKLGKKYKEEREAAISPCGRIHHMAIQPFQIPMVHVGMNL